MALVYRGKRQKSSYRERGQYTAFQHISVAELSAVLLTPKQSWTLVRAQRTLRSVWCMLMNVVLEITGPKRELLHHKWVVVTVMGVIIKEVNEVPTANVKASYQQHNNCNHD